MSSKTPSERAQSVKPEDSKNKSDEANNSEDAKEGSDEKPEENGKPTAAAAAKPEHLPFPGATELNSRLRRLIAAFQRESKKEEQRQAQIDKRNERRERIEQVIREREAQKMEAIQRRWSRGQELDFVKTVLTFGVDFSLKDQTFVWERFRQLAKLDKKFDDTLTEYYNAFVTMCQRVVAKEPVKPITEGMLFSLHMF